MIQHWRWVESQKMKFLVWVAPESFQNEIRNLYDQAAASEQRSRELLDQAKTSIEQLIEQVVQK